MKEDLIPLLLDPRTVNYSKSWLNAQKSSFFDEVKTSLVNEIESCFLVMHPNEKDVEDSNADLSNFSEDFLNSVLYTSLSTMLNGKLM